ncbi:membrane protein insertase YidC [Pelagibacterium luteolum]|uniref:Membrane protein insertase YidC n=1 Tax=Pelagibacterium luteolum TaxID=440168 RepID=A0A1G7YJL1_9HYPH|nr:membrane protein insertase YidC [Pelagibacterium luteolum]SDG96000.1 YidC/Oxa1 family membrane protein insertase [Pelagibacterium luteolum]
MNENNRNMILAVVLSMLVLFGWQFFIAGPQLEQAQRQAQVAAEQQQAAQDSADLAAPAADGSVAAPAAGDATVFENREAALGASTRVAIETDSLSGSINLAGARIDDLHLNHYNETPDADSPTITLLSPAGSPLPYYLEHGWVASAGATVALPDSQTVWELTQGTTLTAETPITLSWDNGQGLVFSRTISVDDNYMFSVEQTVENQGAGDVALFPYSRISRLYTPETQNFFILHEGPIGVLGENNLVERSYGDIQEDGQIDFASTGGWLGFTDKYWATAIIPPQDETINARYFHGTSAPSGNDYRANYVAQSPVVVPAGGTASHESLAFAGAKVESIIDSYEQGYGIDRFELIIDWGWFHFITKPMFYLIRLLYEFLGNFGLAILAVTVIIKAIFFPLANKSYASMANMRRVQPKMKEIQEKHKEDRAAQQQAMMELYKTEKINPLSGCWPILIQIPVFFALYKVLFVTIEMRHAPFFGWIQDLAAPDPTTIFNLFGLLPYDPSSVPVIGSFLMLGIWPLIMGITMWVQMRLNPPPADPTQAMIFNWMPVIFTFMLATFPAGLVIYWAWNNFLSVVQQWFIMRRHGVTVDLLGNIKNSFKRKPKAAE